MNVINLLTIKSLSHIVCNLHDMYHLSVSYVTGIKLELLDCDFDQNAYIRKLQTTLP